MINKTPPPPSFPGTTHPAFIEVEKIMETLNQGKDFTLEGKKVIFAKRAQIIWKGEGALVVKAENGITFELNSLIKSTGPGGLILDANSKGGTDPAATVVFEGKIVKINFSESTGAISLFYNPTALNIASTV